MALYSADFPVGTQVRIAARDVLLGFRRPQWHFHHALQPEQLEFAGVIARVISVGYYHGGDVVYELEGLPGSWHEATLGRVGE